MGNTFKLKMKVFQNGEEVVAYGKVNSRTLVVYHQKVFDVTDFLEHHPGGGDVILPYANQNISSVFHDPDSHSHSSNAAKMLAKHQIGVLSTGETTPDRDTKESDGVSTSDNEYPRISESKIQYQDFSLDLRKGVVWQLVHLTVPRYLEVVHNPVYVPNLRLFDGFMEAFSRTKWWVIPLVWVPTIIGFVIYGLQGNAPITAIERYLRPSSPQFSVLAVLLCLLVGLFFWTKLEYVKHRYLFHMDEKIPGSLGIFIHFILHGIHHFVPLDRDRLVFPPAAAIPFATLYHYFFSLFFPFTIKWLVTAGFLAGYILYDLIHYYLHHGVPTPDSYFGDLKTYHLKHHYKNPRRGFGVSNKLWDYVYGTVLE
eukprot:TRINITY_DN9755_c0_g1_i2.p1 TRINITY_DN9755_c0_g1~~TRINITY_DN9755_c0_g1_i2.p1  ORF type:complete len:401 (-),score=54.22 TRINITY_DN9755_c0_g1_i2:128-1231(-)